MADAQQVSWQDMQPGGTGLPAAAASDTPAAAPALPSLNPTDSPYTPLSLPTAPEPKQHPLPEQEKNDNIGATSKAGAFAYIADKILRGAVQGYDSSRLQHAQQFNKKMSALGTLDQQLTGQFTSAINDTLSSGKTGPDGKPLTRVQIIGDPERKIPPDPSLAKDPEITNIRQIYNQGQAVHQATLASLESYLPHIQDDPSKAKGKGKGKGNDLQDLQTYYNASKQLGWRGGYAGMTDQQAQAAMQQRQTAATTFTTAGVTAGNQLTDQQALAERNRVLGIPTAQRTEKDNSDLQSAEEILTKPAAEKLITTPDTKEFFNHDGVTKFVGQWDPKADGGKGRWTYPNHDPIPDDLLGAQARLAPKLGSASKGAIYKPQTDTITMPDGSIIGRHDPNQTPEQVTLFNGASEAMRAHQITHSTENVHLIQENNSWLPVVERSTTSGGPAGLPRVGEGSGVAAPSTTPPRTMVVPHPKGLVEAGSLPIDNRPTVQNANGSHSSELSFSREDNGREVLVPSVVDGKFMTPDGKMPPLGHKDAGGKYVPTPEEKAMQDRAWQHYKDSGENLGKFDSPANADAYANLLHLRGEAKQKAAAAAHSAAPNHAPSPSSSTAPPPAHKSASGAGIVSVGKPLGHKLSPVVNKAQEALNDTIKVLAVANDAVTHSDGSTQYLLMTSLLHSAIGRVNMVEITNMMRSAGFGTTAEGWFTHAKSGQLPLALVKQLQGAARTWARGAAVAVDAAIKEESMLGGQGSALDLVNTVAGGGTAGGGTGSKIDVTDPKGKIHHFDTQEQANHFKQLAGIK